MKERKILIISGIAVLICIIFPYLYLQTNAYLLIHDNLDSEFVFCHLLKMTGLLFGFNGDTILPNIMNGVPRNIFHSEFSFIRLLFYLFPSFWAYVINSALVRIIGFIGMYFFAKDYLVKGGDKKIAILLAVLFSIIPLYTLFGLSVMGQPILVWAFLNLCNNKKQLVNWIIIALFPFYAHFAVIAPFILVGIFLYGIYKMLAKDQTISRSYFWGLALLFLCFVIVNFITIKSFLFPGDFISHRNEWIAQSYSFNTLAKRFLFTFTNGQYHSSSFVATPIYVFSLLTWFFVKKDRKKSIDIFLPIVLIGVISLFDAIYPYLSYTLQKPLHILVSFQFNRFTFLIPFLWIVTFGIAITYAINKVPKVIIVAFILLQTGLITWKNEELKYNYAKILVNREYKPSFNSFYASHLFADIAEFINKPKKDYRVVSLGMHPSVAQYNGFYTLDSYQNNYRLEYKHEFRNIIASELDKNEELRIYFDYWGSRCNVFSSELRKTYDLMCAKEYNAYVNNLSIDTEALRKNGRGVYFIGSYYWKLQRIKLEVFEEVF